MEYINTPNLPDRKVNTVLISPDCPKNILQELSVNRVDTFKTAYNPALEDITSGHPDMSILHLGGNQFICDKNAYEYYKMYLIAADIIALEGEICPEYPGDAALNVGIVGEFAFFNPKSITEQMYEYIKMWKYQEIPVNQGYSKCNIVPVSANAIITEDRSIYKAAKTNGLDTLLIRSGNISLSGYKYGFIGGACGKLAHDALAITGSLKFIPERESIVSFCRSHGVDIIELSNQRPCDIGSILPIL